MQYSGKLALQQRVLPSYRVPFFDTLAKQCAGGMALFAGEAGGHEAIKGAVLPDVAKFTRGKNTHLFNGPAYLCWQQGLVDWLERENPDALIVEANPRYISTPKAIAWMKERGRPVLGWGLGAPALHGSLAGIRQRARLRLLNSLDGVLAYSQRGAAEYRALGMPTERVFTAYNAAAARPTTAPPTRLNQFENGKPIVLFVGRLQARKRLDILFEACAKQAVRPEVWIVGDGPARADFEAQAEAMYPEAKFFGAKHGEALAMYFEQADVFALPGTGGLAIQQAMSHALPVIVAEGDGTQDDLVRPENGWVVRANNLDDFSNALREALKDVKKLRDMGQASYRITVEEINLERMAENFVHALRTIANE